MNILEVYKSKKINSNYYFEENQTVSNKVVIMPMKTGDIQSFNIYQEGGVNCSSSGNTIYVKKDREINGEWLFKRNFYVSTNKDFVINDKESMKYRYIDQGGYISCTEGFIYKISIDNSIAECSNEISTLLATLCMIDPELNSMSDRNYSFNKLEADDPMEFVLKYCKKLIGVTMSKTKNKAADTYFTAAMASGFTKMLVKGENNPNFMLLDVHVAKKEYNVKTGAIKNVSPKWNNWIFCKQ